MTHTQAEDQQCLRDDHLQVLLLISWQLPASTSYLFNAALLSVKTLNYQISEDTKTGSIGCIESAGRKI